MPKMCAAFGCRGNYRGEPYTPVVRFPDDAVERQTWISCMPNSTDSLIHRKEIYVCASHFSCEWVTTRGGKRPIGPPTVFTGVPQSCLKQAKVSHRPTEKSSAETRLELQKTLEESLDKINNFNEFVISAAGRYPTYYSKLNGDTLSLFMVNDNGSKVKNFVSFQEVQSPFGFLRVHTAERNGHTVPQNKLSLQKNNLVSRWSQIDFILKVLSEHRASNEDHLESALKELSKIDDYEGSAHLQFIHAQLQMLLRPSNNLNFAKNIIVLASELLCVSPAAYRMLRNSGVMKLPREQLIRNLMSRSFQDSNLKPFFDSLKPQQRLVNILFDEVKLKKTLRFMSGHILGQAVNAPDLQATSALVFELVCHHGGPRLIVRLYPVAKLDADKLQCYLLECIRLTEESGGRPVSVICDNCAVNQSVYRKLGGPGEIKLQQCDHSIYLVYDYVHVFKNLRNNWLTEKMQELAFVKDNVEYVARWSDIRKVHDEDKKTALRLTKLTHTSVFPKPLQRQSVPLVCQVFNDKTVAGLKFLTDKLSCADGTVVFVSLVNDWFKMMNVKDKFMSVKLRDECRVPWTENCDTFKKLTDFCNVIDSCKWDGVGVRQQKLTKFTAEACVVTTKFNIAAATYLLVDQHFK